MNLELLAILLFAAMYAGLIFLPKYRPYIALGTAVIFVALGIQPVSGLLEAVNWNVLLMLLGTMGTVSLFIESKMPNRLSDRLLNHSSSVMAAAVVLSLFSGFISAFIDNVATVLILAPIGLSIARKLKISPVSLLICISISSNLQGAATLVGDTTSILLGGYAGMDFLDFFFMNGKPSIFWSVELGALCTVPIIAFIFRKNRQPIEKTALTEVKDYAPTILLILNIVLLIAASFIPNKPEMTNGLICMEICLIGLIKKTIQIKSFRAFHDAAKEVDWQTLLLLAGLFIVISGITEVGVIDDMSTLLTRIGGKSVLSMYILLVLGSVLLSAFIDNIPYVATMLPVVQGIAAQMGCNPLLFYFGLLCGATLGGNLTPVGASANIVTIGLLRKEGEEVKNKDFLRIGVPFTLVAVCAGAIFCYFIWA